MTPQEHVVFLAENQSDPKQSSSHPSITHGSFYGLRKAHPNPEEDRVRRPFEYPRIMILDGGVVHQIAVLSVLEQLLLCINEIERTDDYKVQSSSDSPLIRWSQVDDGFRFCHYFDYICGTSWGGISAVLLGRQKATIEEALTTVQRISEDKTHKLPQDLRSPVSIAWSASSLLRYLKQFVRLESASRRDTPTKRHSSGNGVLDGADWSAKMESIFGMCRTSVLTSYDDATHSHVPYILRSYEILNPDNRGFKNSNQPTHTMQIRDVCNAAIAPWNHPREVEVPGIEGSLHEAARESDDSRVILEQEIAALHSGRHEQFEYKLWNEVKKPPGTLPSIEASEPETPAEESLVDIYLDHFHLKIPGLAQEPKSDASDTSQRIETMVKEYCAIVHVRETLYEMAKKMVASRKHRAGFERWETFAFGVHYKCCVCEDDGRNSGFMDIDTWSSHVANEHKIPPFTVEERCRVMP